MVGRNMTEEQRRRKRGRQRKTKGKEEKHNGGEAERERLRGVRRNSSEEQRYGSQVHGGKDMTNLAV